MLNLNKYLSNESAIQNFSCDVKRNRRDLSDFPLLQTAVVVKVEYNRESYETESEWSLTTLREKWNRREIFLNKLQPKESVIVFVSSNRQRFDIHNLMFFCATFFFVSSLNRMQHSMHDNADQNGWTEVEKLEQIGLYSANLTYIHASALRGNLSLA